MIDNGIDKDNQENCHYTFFPEEIPKNSFSPWLDHEFVKGFWRERNGEGKHRRR